MSTKEELKTIKALSSMLKEVDEPNKRIYEPESEENICIMDPADFCMIIAKSPTAKRLLCSFMLKDESIMKMPTLDYTHSGLCCSKYSIEYLTKIIKLLSCSGESAKFIIGSDYPATIENDEFKVILAPRVNND